MIMNQNFKFSGHETFPFRYAWLPKAYLALKADTRIFSDIENAMVTMGVGKNMVRAIQFWVQASGIAEAAPNGGYVITDFGNALLSHDGFDPFLEDIRTLWLLHWKLASNVEEPLFAWDYLLNQWRYPELTRSQILPVFAKEAERLGRKLSAVTLEQHFDTFIHTYVPTQSTKGDIREDNLDSPLVELELIQKVGERKADKTGKRETIYAFRWEEKPDITQELFIYCLLDFWDKRRSNEKTLNFSDVSFAHGSLGQIFKLPELIVRERLESIEIDSKGILTYQESAASPQIVRNDLEKRDSLTEVYKMEGINA